MATEKLYKFLRKDGTGPYSGQVWSLPTDDAPGEWMSEIEGRLVVCKNGYHLCREQDAARWINTALYEAEYDGERVDAADKIVVRRARLLRRVAAWNERTMRLFACDCAEHVLDLFERRHPGDERPHQAIAVARRYANGEATVEELRAARQSAAATAAYAAAYAAYAATAAAYAAYAATAAYAAAYAATADAAAADAATAAYAADAAAYAATAAAYAAYAATATADADAAYAAAADAYDHAGKQEREWQAGWLLAYINGEIN